jgi:hypothetical protein
MGFQVPFAMEFHLWQFLSFATLTLTFKGLPILAEMAGKATFRSICFFLTLGGLWVCSQVGWLTKRARAWLKSNEPARRGSGRVLAITRGWRHAAHGPRLPPCIRSWSRKTDDGCGHPRIERDCVAIGRP